MRPERDADYGEYEEPEEGEGGAEPRVAADGGDVAVLAQVGRRRREGHVAAAAAGVRVAAAANAGGPAAATATSNQGYFVPPGD